MSLYTWRKRGKVALIVLYVYDILIASNNLAKLQKEIENKLSLVFQMKDVGKPKNFLGINILRDRENSVIKINKTEYIRKIIKNLYLIHFVLIRCNNFALRSLKNSRKRGFVKISTTFFL